MQKAIDRAFTLIEVIIVITVILILSSTVLTGYRQGEKQFSLQRSSHILAQDLRNTQDMAMAGKKAPLAFGEVFPKGGYGLYFETNLNSYILFADCNDNGQYDAGGAASSCESATSANPYPERIEDLYLETDTEISGISPSSPLSITFFPPDPIITINPATNLVIVTLSLGGNTRTVSINTVGLIDID
ncbi:MAG: prepilin-type N-terminal cleavage/methylation domain-containing protein [Patescibacteria group bacterium]|nr:prepilin-type N-terminal cleavage/methylation domain-containing protein [Patescibacteria group bacterium]